MKLFRSIFFTILTLSFLVTSFNARAFSKIEIDSYGIIGNDWGVIGASAFTFSDDKGAFSTMPPWAGIKSSGVIFNYLSFVQPWIFASLSFHSGDLNTPLTVGVYENAQRYPFNDPGRPGLEFSSTSGFNTLDGRFEIYEIKNDSFGNVISLAASFEIFNYPAPIGKPITGGRIWYNFVPSVPEPESIATLFIGLGLLGLAVRRKKQT